MTTLADNAVKFTETRPGIVVLRGHHVKSANIAFGCVGMTDYVAKPIRPETVGAALERVRRGRFRPRVEASAETLATFNRRHVVELLGGDTAAVREFIGLLTRDLPPYVRVLLDGARASDLTASARAAHRIAGAVGNIAPATVGEIAAAIEQLARQGDAESVSAKCAVLEVATAELMRDLDAWMRELNDSAATEAPGPST